MTNQQINLAKEWGFSYDVKMDAVSLQGVWLTSAGGTHHGHGHVYAAGIILQLIEEEAQKNRSLLQHLDNSEERRQHVLELMQRRLEREEWDDLMTVLSL